MKVVRLSALCTFLLLLSCDMSDLTCILLVRILCLQMLAPSQTEEKKSVITRGLDATFYITFNILLVL